MDNFKYSAPLVFRSRLSFQPLIRAWQEIIENNPEGGKTYSRLLEELSQHSELLEPIDDLQLLKKHKQIIEQMMTTVFPISILNQEKLFGITEPFGTRAVFASADLKKNLQDKKENYLHGTDEQAKENIELAKMHMAYKLILEKFYGIKLTGSITCVCTNPDTEKNISNYLELEFDSQFIDVYTDAKLPLLPENYITEYCRVSDISHYAELPQLLPLDEFIFNGIAIVYIRDATEKAVIHHVKKILQSDNAFVDTKLFTDLQQQIRYLLNMPEIQTGITPFVNINNYFAGSKLNFSNSILLKDVHEAAKRAALCKYVTEAFTNDSLAYLFISKLSKEKSGQNTFLKHLIEEGWTSTLIFPLHHHDEVIGSLEISSKDTVLPNTNSAARIKPVIELIEDALQKSIEHFENQVNKVIKEQFTAVQSSVEWKFANTAINYLSQLQKGEEAKMEQIIFDNVYPLYGSVDIRNSSGERNLAVQQDMIDQLKWIKKILASAQERFSFPLLQEVESRIDNYSSSISNFLFTNDEQTVQLFLKEEAATLLRYLQEAIPDISSEIETYFMSVDERLHMLTHNRKKFEESVTRINNQVTRFLDREQSDAQNIYPHYFERFVTDGVEFNIYIGQSITPEKKFNSIYLKNLKLWQITTLAMAAQRIHRMQPDLPIPLQTTQLILVHSEPISISFRSAERKFDVDGVYNARYEVLKKRIDKVHIKNTNERLTKPGTIAIVYSHPDEVDEYLLFIEYLKKRNLIAGEAEKFDLEELQGVSGLKALRVKVMLEDQMEEEEKKEPHKGVHN